MTWNARALIPIPGTRWIEPRGGRHRAGFEAAVDDLSDAQATSEVRRRGTSKEAATELLSRRGSALAVQKADSRIGSWREQILKGPEDSGSQPAPVEVRRLASMRI